MDSGSDEGKDWATSVASGRPDSSVLLRKPGDVFDLQFSIRPPGHRKQQVREPVDPSDDIRADRFGMRQLHDLPLGPPRDRSGHVEAGGNFGAAGSTKVVMGAFPDSTSSMNCSISATAASGRRTVFSSWEVPSGVARSAPISNRRLWHRCRMACIRPRKPSSSEGIALMAKPMVALVSSTVP